MDLVRGRHRLFDPLAPFGFFDGRRHGWDLVPHLFRQRFRRYPSVRHFARISGPSPVRAMAGPSRYCLGPGDLLSFWSPFLDPLMALRAALDGRGNDRDDLLDGPFLSALV